DNGNGTWTLTPAQLSGLTLTPAANSDVGFNLQVTATSTESANGSTATSTIATLAVTVNAVADAPTVTVTPASGAEDSPIALNIGAALNDTDGSESITAVTISGVPSGASLSAGTDNGNGTWTLTPDQLSGLTLTPAANSDVDFSLQVTATSTESANRATPTSTIATLAVTVDAVADVPTVTVTPATGAEDSPIALNIGAA